MSCLIEVHRSAPPVRVLYEAVRRRGGCLSYCLVHTIASGRPAEVEAGKRLLLEAARALHLLDRALVLTARLEIGDAAERLLSVAAELQPELIVMSAHGEGEFPRLAAEGRTARRVLEWSRLPVLLISPAEDRLYPSRRLRARARRAAEPRSRIALRLAPAPLQTPAAPL